MLQTMRTNFRATAIFFNHSNRHVSQLRKNILFEEIPQNNSYTVVLRLNGDKKAKRNVIFAMIMKKMLLTTNFRLPNSLFVIALSS